MGKTVQLQFDEVTPWKIATVILGILLIISIITGGFSGSSSGTVNDNQQIQAPAQQAPEQPKYVNVAEANNPSTGKANAPITIIEFSDFQCPFCERFYTQTLPSIKSNYIDTGKARLVYRDFPLSFHPNAMPAAIAAECANQQGKFWEFHDKLFDNQATWSGLPDTKDTFVGYANDLGLKADKFTSCLSDPKTKASIDADESDGTKYGVSGTPSFFVNGRLLVGAQPYAAFQAVIDQELSK